MGQYKILGNCPWGGGGGGYSRFQVTGIIERFLGVWNSRFGDFPVGTFGKYFFGRHDLSRYFLGVQNNLKIRGSARISQRRSSANKVQPNFNAFWKFLRLENSARVFWGVNFWPRGFWGVLLEALGIFPLAPPLLGKLTTHLSPNPAFHPNDKLVGTMG